MSPFSFSPLGSGLGEEPSSISPRSRLLNSIERVDDELLFEEKVRQVNASYSNVYVARHVPGVNLHSVEVPFDIPEPSELLLDVLASKLGDNSEQLLNQRLSGRVVLLVCTTAEGRISAVSTSAHIGTSRITLQELYDCGILPQRAPTLQLVTVVSRIWRALRCTEKRSSSPKKQAGGRTRQDAAPGGANIRVPRPPAVSRKEVASFLASGAPGARSLMRELEQGRCPSVTEANVMDCFKSTVDGLAWLFEAREMVRTVEEVREEKASRVDGLKNQIAVLQAELRSKSEECREKSDRRDELRRILAPDVLKDQLSQAAVQSRLEAQSLVEAWKEGKGRDDVFVRAYVNALAAAYAMDAKRERLDLV